jgi:hypothetical protein
MATTRRRYGRGRNARRRARRCGCAARSPRSRPSSRRSSASSYFSERSQTEIAGELGIPLGTVKSRTRLAMNRLRALLEDETMTTKHHHATDETLMRYAAGTLAAASRHRRSGRIWQACPACRARVADLRSRSAARSSTRTEADGNSRQPPSATCWPCSTRRTPPPPSGRNRRGRRSRSRACACRTRCAAATSGAGAGSAPA